MIVSTLKPAEKIICSDEHLYKPILANNLFCWIPCHFTQICGINRWFSDQINITLNSVSGFIRPHHIEAEIIKGKLEASGVESYIFKDDCGGMRPHMQLTDGVKLKVSEPDLLKAKAIVAISNEDKVSSKTKTVDSAKKIRQLLHRARGWVLIGFAVIPGWISFPLAFIYASIASKRLKESNIKDKSLKNSILRIRLVSAFFTILFWSIAIYYYRI